MTNALALALCLAFLLTAWQLRTVAERLVALERKPADCPQPVRLVPLDHNRV